VTKQSPNDSVQRLRQMHDQLAQAYGPQHWWPAKSPFEVILGAYLTQNTSWKAVEVSLGNLRKADALSIVGIRNLSVDKLRELLAQSTERHDTTRGPFLSVNACAALAQLIRGAVCAQR